MIKQEDIKKYVNKKILLGLLAFLMVIGIIVVTSFINVALDPSQFMTKQFWSNELIICAIVIFGMVCSMFIGQSGNAQTPKSNIAKARVAFNESVVKIENISAFHQWVKQVFQPNDIKAMKEREMRLLGIDDYSVIELTINEIKSLKDTPQKIGDRYYKPLTENQIKELIKLKEYKIRLVQPDYYLNVRTIDADKTITERAGNEGKKKTYLMSVSLGSKLIMTIIIAMILAALVQDTTSEVQTGQAIMTFFSRMTSLITSAFMGYMVGCQQNDIDADFINMRVSVQTMFLQDKTFKPKSQQDEAKEEFKERVRQENEKLLLEEKK